MISKELEIPFYAKASIFLVGLFVFLTILYITQDIIIPIVFAIIIAIVLHPVVNFFIKKRIPKVIAILITITLTFIFIAGIGTLIFTQASKFLESWPILVEKFIILLNQTIVKSSGYFNIEPQYIHNWLNNAKTELINSSSSSIGHALMAVGGWLMILFIIPVFVFLFLFYHSLLLEFIHRLFAINNQTKLNKIISRIKTVIQQYLIGLVIEIIIVSGLNTIALLVIGVEYALLLGVIGGFLNLIPYIGGVVAIALPMVVAFVTLSSPWYAISIFGLYTIIQLIDNNIIVPLIVASKVKINALFSIIIVIAGNAFWGISGMFLSIPLLAILKVIFDHIDILKPWGFLLGDTIPKKDAVNFLKVLIKK